MLEEKDGTENSADLHKENPLRAEKRRKLKDLRAANVDPYPHNFERNNTTAGLRKEFEALNVQERREDVIVRLAGRVMSVRQMGKASFFNVQDQSGQLQCYVKPADLAAAGSKSFELLDLGDIVGVVGFPFKTKTGELSVHVAEFVMLCKTLEPLPEKFHGVTDVEIKYRHRHLDLISDVESRKVFETRSKIIREIRRFLDDRGFLEVETPILQPIYGGAAARPFETHHNALDMKLFMKISPELYLKRLIVGGFEKVYDLSKNFRNEGIDRSHNPEFQMIEWYEAYTDYLYQMNQFESLCAHVCLQVKGTTKFEYQGKEIDFTTPWPRYSMTEAIQKFGGLDVGPMTDQQIFDECRKRGLKGRSAAAASMPLFGLNRGELISNLFEMTSEEHLWNPTFIIDHPTEISPLTKKHRTKAGCVERFEPFAAKMEIGNSYTELNDPEEQLARLKEQEAQRVVNDEAQPMDEDFMHAIDVGMPPTGGVGLGVERLVMILTDRPSIRDIILFPTMKMK